MTSKGSQLVGGGFNLPSLTKGTSVCFSKKKKQKERAKKIIFNIELLRGEPISFARRGESSSTEKRASSVNPG